ncbi:MAG: hypothetical protein SO011_09595 [Prevotella sp.]|nr:hypothetical protein [Bacteroidales bacterium]MDY3843264.1 hypothetical protein [Prevotella sp.]
MRRLQCLACLILLVLGSCTERKATPNVASMEQTDSLQRIIAQRDNEINDMMGTLNEIQEGLREINEAENRLSVAKNGEGSSRSVQIKENIRFIANTMAHNRELIKKLQQQLRESRFGGDELRKTIESLTQQLDEKEQQLQKLRAELDSKDIHIAQLDEKISNLNTNVENLKIETQEKSQTIGNQDKQLNTAWFVFGTKKELKEQHILVDGKVLQSNFNKSYFTKIDIRVDKEIKLYSKSARVLTMHPSSSYTLARDANNQYVLRISNPQIFWSTSKYLVILVK